MHLSFKRNKQFREEILKAIRGGPKTTHQLYKIIKKRCPEYCNDREKCTHYAMIHTQQPEWKHRVRCVQNALQKEFLIYFDKGPGTWKIVE